ncbi:MAG: hypothetical protein WC208_08315 [Gallionella sp.]|jgi:hypothetical protein
MPKKRKKKSILMTIDGRVYYTPEAMAAGRRYLKTKKGKAEWNRKTRELDEAFKRASKRAAERDRYRRRKLSKSR